MTRHRYYRARPKPRHPSERPTIDLSKHNIEKVLDEAAYTWQERCHAVLHIFMVIAGQVDKYPVGNPGHLPAPFRGMTAESATRWAPGMCTAFPEGFNYLTAPGALAVRDHTLWWNGMFALRTWDIAHLWLKPGEVDVEVLRALAWCQGLELPGTTPERVRAALTRLLGHPRLQNRVLKDWAPGGALDDGTRDNAKLNLLVAATTPADGLTLGKRSFVAPQLQIVTPDNLVISPGGLHQFNITFQQWYGPPYVGDIFMYRTLHGKVFPDGRLEHEVLLDKATAEQEDELLGKALAVEVAIARINAARAKRLPAPQGGRRGAQSGDGEGG